MTNARSKGRHIRIAHGARGFRTLVAALAEVDEQLYFFGIQRVVERSIRAYLDVVIRIVDGLCLDFCVRRDDDDRFVFETIFCSLRGNTDLAVAEVDLRIFIIDQ